MGRTTLIAVLGAAVVGSTGGGLAALHFTSPRPRPATVASGSDAGSRSGSGPTAASDAGVPDATASDLTSAPADHPRAVLATQMTAVLTRFAAWSRDHTGAPCPDLATLGLSARDPWGHDLELTCTDQPADQMIGALSDGPDRVRGTDDDVPSWTLGPGVTSLVRGPRWKPAPSALPLRATRPPGHRYPPDPIATPLPHTPPASPTPRAPQIPRANEPTAPAPKSPPPPDPTGDDIPTRRSSR